MGYGLVAGLKVNVATDDAAPGTFIVSGANAGSLRAQFGVEQIETAHHNGEGTDFSVRFTPKGDYQQRLASELTAAATIQGR